MSDHIAEIMLRFGFATAAERRRTHLILGELLESIGPLCQHENTGARWYEEEEFTIKEVSCTDCGAKLYATRVVDLSDHPAYGC